jgi:very-short-patch-repair endonuclease
MDPVTELNLRGGVARTRTLLRVGVSEHALRRAKESGAVLTVRNGWVSLPDADRMKVTAAKRGVVLSCVTLAARCGLWVPDSSQVHVAAPAHAGRVDAGIAVVHWARPMLPRLPDECEDSLENALVLVAGCQPFEDALVVWESALNKRLVDPEVLRRLPLPPAAARVLEHARPFSDSGLETIVPNRLRWMNLPMLQQVWLLGKPVDLLIGERLVLQIDGGHHVGAQRTRDIEHDAQLTLRGYHVIRVGYDQVMNQWPQVQALIMDAVAQRLHLA